MFQKCLTISHFSHPTHCEKEKVLTYFTENADYNPHIITSCIQNLRTKLISVRSEFIIRWRIVLDKVGSVS